MPPLIFTKKRSRTLIIDTLTAGKPGDNSDTLKEKNHRKEHKNCDNNDDTITNNRNNDDKDYVVWTILKEIH